MNYEVYTCSDWKMPVGRRKDGRNFIKEVTNTVETLLNSDQPGGIFFWVQLLAQALVTRSKNYARTEGLHKMVETKMLNRFFSSQILSYLSDHALDLLPELPDLDMSPGKAWGIKLEFSLRKPYLSKDDTEFYILDNPVRKEWVFKVPYIAPSQWKGALRAAMVQELKRWWESFSNDEKAAHLEEFAERRFRMTLLFGDEKGEEPGSLKGLAKYLDDLGGEEATNLYRQKVKKFFNTKAESLLPHHRGWLYFYPTYFDRIGLEVINPHSRETGAGERPIHFESVPADTKGRFVLLYVPLGEVGEAEMREDFRAVAQGLKAMFTKYGFGAKTNSGFGRANVEYKTTEICPDTLKPLWGKVWKDREVSDE